MTGKDRTFKLLLNGLPLGLGLTAGIFHALAGRWGLGLWLVIIGGLCLGLAITLALESVSVLLGLTAGTERQESSRRSAAIEWQKDVTLRSIKEMELDVAMEKIDPQEAQEIMAPLRKQALELLRAIDLAHQRERVSDDERIQSEILEGAGEWGAR